MENKYNKLIVILLFVFGIVFTIIGATFAYFGARANATGNAISGSSYVFNMNLDVSSVRTGNLIPVEDDLISTSLAGNYKCEDQRDYGLCSLYRLRFTNNGNAESLVGYLQTISTTYTTGNLRYRLYDINYNPVSDIGTVSITPNDTNYFKSGTLNINIEIGANSTKDYYLAIWIHDIGENQLEDQDKLYTGRIVFTSLNGEKITSNFIDVDDSSSYVIFDADGGTTPVTRKAVTIGQSYGELPTPTKEGYTFKGWSRLPSGYQEVEYISGSGTQYIMTDITPNNTTGVYTKLVSKLTDKDKIFFGCGTSSDNKRFWAGNTSNHPYYGWNEYKTVNSTINTSTVNIIQLNYLNNRKLIYNGTSNYSNINTLVAKTNKMTIFGYNKQETGVISLIASMNLYVFKVSQGSNIMANFIPCYRSDGRVGLYEIHSGQFYDNKASTTTNFGYQNNVYITSSSVVESDHTHKLTAIWE